MSKDAIGHKNTEMKACCWKRVYTVVAGKRGAEVKVHLVPPGILLLLKLDSARPLAPDTAALAKFMKLRLVNYQGRQPSLIIVFDADQAQMVL